MRFWNNGKGESNVLQNQFTRYLKTAVQRKKMDILRERKKVYGHEYYDGTWNESSCMVTEDTYGRVQELKRLTEESDIQILLAGCAEPDLKAAALQEKFQGATPAETVKAMLLPGEIADLAIAVEKLSGYRRTTIEEVKNG